LDKPGQDRLLNGAWKHADIFEEEGPQRERRVSPLWFAALALALVMSYVLVARAHIHGPPEWNDVISSATNATGRLCCGEGEAQLLKFDTVNLLHLDGPPPVGLRLAAAVMVLT
jgi:hypothetical protein